MQLRLRRRQGNRRMHLCISCLDDDPCLRPGGTECHNSPLRVHEECRVNSRNWCEALFSTVSYLRLGPTLILRRDKARGRCTLTSAFRTSHLLPTPGAPPPRPSARSFRPYVRKPNWTAPLSPFEIIFRPYWHGLCRHRAGPGGRAFDNYRRSRPLMSFLPAGHRRLRRRWPAGRFVFRLPG